MTSNITDAIKQLIHDADSLRDAIPTMDESADAKQIQIQTLRNEYVATHPEIIAGEWNLDISIIQEHTHLTGWKYDYPRVECVGDDSGNSLVSAFALMDDEYSMRVEIPYGDEEHLTCVSPRIELTLARGEIRIDFYNIDQAEIFHFIKEHNISVEVPDMDKSIIGLRKQLTELNVAKQAVIDAGLIKGKFKSPPVRDQLFHQPIVDDILPVEESEGVQFNAEEVSALHKRVGITYEILTNAISKLNNFPADVEVVNAATIELYYVQTEIDQLAVDIGDLDTKDEPLDVGMAGSVHWNLIQGAINHLDGTVNYIEAQDIPLFTEVHYRLKKLVEILQRCSDEFGDTYLGGNYDDE